MITFALLRQNENSHRYCYSWSAVLIQILGDDEDIEKSVNFGPAMIIWTFSPQHWYTKFGGDSRCKGIEHTWNRRLQNFIALYQVPEVSCDFYTIFQEDVGDGWPKYGRNFVRLDFELFICRWWGGSIWALNWIFYSVKCLNLRLKDFQWLKLGTSRYQRFP